MSGLQARGEDNINGVDVREQGSALRVATNTPHLVSLGTGRLSTAVTLHPIKQGRVTIGSDPTCEIYVVGTGVAPIHCRVENSHGVVTLYPVSGCTLMDGLPVDKPTRLSQGSMLTIGRSNYLRFNHPEEAKLMKSVLPTHLSMAPSQFTPNDGYSNHQEQTIQCYQNANIQVQKSNKENTLSQLDQELDLTLKDLSRKKPPVAPRKPYFDQSDSSDQEGKPKVSSIMAKVSKFEYYAKQQKNIGRSQFYTSNENEISPKVFSSNSLTVNTPAKDVLGGKTVPNYMNKPKDQKVIQLSENNSIDPKSCSYANVAIRKTNKIEDIVRNFDENSRLPKKINNDQNNIYGKINTDKNLADHKNNAFGQRNNALDQRNNAFDQRNNAFDQRNNAFDQRNNDFDQRGKDFGSNEINLNKVGLPSPAFDRNPQYSPVYGNCYYERGLDAETQRIKAYQDRIKEEEQKEAETARLEEILNMCAEYERQISSGIPITPTEKRPHNKIITNGSLPRSGALNNPNFVQTSEGYYKFETSHNHNNSMSQSLPIQRNLSHYENFNISDQEQLTPEVTIKNQSNSENVGRMDEIGIPVFDDSPKHELSSPIMIRKLQNGDKLSTSPIGSPYENVYYNRGNPLMKPKSPNTNSPRTRIKTTFAHKNLPSPQYFVFPTPPPVENKPDFYLNMYKNNAQNMENVPSPKEFNDFNQQKIINTKSDCDYNKQLSPKDITHHNINTVQNVVKESSPKDFNKVENNAEKGGIEKQLSLEEEIPMIDDVNITNDLEFRYATIDKSTEENKRNSLKDDVTETKNFIEKEIEIVPEKLTKNKSFDDVKKELMADIPELEEFERDLKENKREKIIKNITDDMKKMNMDADSLDSILDDNAIELKNKYNKLKDERKKLITEIHDLKNKMSEIRSQEDDILRELEMEKALIKGEYDSEIAILNIEQKKKSDLVEKARKIEEEIKQLKEKQEQRQNEMKDRVEVATLKVERIEKDIKDHQATMEELQNAQDILDNETKICEDLEFQHLEEESELLANREDIQNEIILLTKKIEAQKSRILTLKSEANDNLTSALDETKILQAEYVRLLNQVENLTGLVQGIEKELKPIVTKLNDIERTQSPDSAFYTDQTRAKSGEFGYSPQSSDSDDLDLTKISSFEDHSKEVKDKFSAIDRMSQSMIVDIERRIITDLDDRISESPSKSSTSSKEKKGFWERNFDSLKRKKKPKSPEKSPDIMSQSLNENMFYNNETIETDNSMDRFNSLRHSKKKDKPSGPVKSNSSSKIPTFAALGKIIKKDSFGKRSAKNDSNEPENKNRYVKNTKVATENKYNKSKSLSPDKTIGETISEEIENQNENTNLKVFTQNGDAKMATLNLNNFRKAVDGKILHRKSCGDEPNGKPVISEFQKISDSGKIPSQDDIDRISKVTMDAPILSSDTDMNTLGKRTFDSLMEIERKRMVMLEEQGCQVIENEREKISELKRRAQDETKKLWDQKSREQSKSIDSDTCQSLPTEIGRNDNVDTKKEFRKNSLDSKPDYNDSNNRNDILDRSDNFGKKEELRRNQYDRGDSYDRSDRFDRGPEDSSLVDDSYNMTNSTIFEESSGLMSSSIEELQVRNSRTESTEEEKLSDTSRPLSHASDFSRDNILSMGTASRRGRRLPYSEQQRPLTRYLPVDRDDFDLRAHVETAGHQIELCPYVAVSATSCRGYLHKLGAKFHTWSKRWFVFDRETKTFVYYWDKSEKKPRGGAYFQVIEEVYLDHGNTSKSPSPQTTFIVKTRQRRYYLMAPSGEAARIWIDVIFTGAQGYTDYLE